ncbi:Uncharacterized protein SCF082_LOCUS38118 [Durusdinium trenchii]|uniref:Uncharacterized protein n=1 Tax=Durusdinium trenchii TaxID=1381693 RepID=A0ABP0PY95_9DINO
MLLAHAPSGGRRTPPAPGLVTSVVSALRETWRDREAPSNHPAAAAAAHAAAPGPLHRALWRSAEPEAVTRRGPPSTSGTPPLPPGLLPPSGSRSSTETQAPERPPVVRFASAPQVVRQQLQEYVAQRVANGSAMDHLPGEPAEQLSGLLALTPGSVSREEGYSELLDVLGAISAAARRQTLEHQHQLQQERLLAAERLGFFESQAQEMRDELAGLKKELKDSELLLRESRAEQSAEVALKAQLAEERRKAKEQLEVQEQLELKLREREDELQAAQRRAEQREKVHAQQLAELKERLQEFYEAQHQQEVKELIVAAAQEVNLLPRPDDLGRAQKTSGPGKEDANDEEMDARHDSAELHRHDARQRFLSPSLLSSAEPNSAELSSFILEEANNAADIARSAGLLECSPLSACDPKSDQLRGSLLSSLAPSSEAPLLEPSPTESTLSAALAPRSPPTVAAQHSAPSAPGTGSSLAFSSSEGSQVTRGRPLSRSRPPSPAEEAPPRGYVAEKIIFFDRGATPPPKGGGTAAHVPTPLGRHVLPRPEAARKSPTVVPQAPEPAAPLELVASPPTHKECRRRLSYPEEPPGTGR